MDLTQLSLAPPQVRQIIQQSLAEIDTQLVQARVNLAAYRDNASWQLPDEEGTTPYQRLCDHLQTILQARANVLTDFGAYLS